MAVNDLLFSTNSGNEGLPALMLTIAFAAVSSFFVFFAVFAKEAKKKRALSLSLKNSNNTQKGPSSRRKEIVTCPFSSETSFVQETAEHLTPSPLDVHSDWTEHLASRWLAAGLSGQDTPGYLRAGLKRLRHSQHFLVEEPHLIREELLLKRKNLDDPSKHHLKFVMEQSSLDAQRETLELFMAYLPQQYPELYTYDKTTHSVTVHPLCTTFALDDWADRPLELCERIVQEDLILMRPGPAYSPTKEGEELDPSETNPSDSSAKEGFYMAAAAVVFSFSELQEKLGEPAEIIHAPVPGFQEHVRKSLNLMFSRLQPEQPLWRNNWGLAPKGTLDDPLYGSEETLENRTMKSDVTVEDVKKLFLKVEYQTIRRLPRTGYLLFTVKTMVDAVSGLEDVPPRAALCLATSIRGMSPAMRRYKGIADSATCKAVLSYLDSITGKEEEQDDKST